MDRVKFLNIEINNVTKVELLNENLYGIVFTPNVDHLIKLQKDEEFYMNYSKANWVVCDSKIIQLFSKFLFTPIKEVIPGSDLFPEYCQIVASNPIHNKKIFLLGGTTNAILEKAVYNLQNHHICKFIVGAYSPPFGFENSQIEIDKIVQLINDSGANVLAVAIGAPKQENLIFKLKDLLYNIQLYFAIGATLDFISGKIKRAPKVFQTLKLEWLFRMLSNPKRLAKRYLIDDLPIFYFVLKYKFGSYKNPFKD